MDIQRNEYIERLYTKSWNGKVKIITGIRRSGKSYLLSHLYKQFLINKGYLDYLEDAYLISHAERYDVKGRRYFENIKKYYATDLGLRNARLNFRQQERSRLMENMIYNELIRRGYRVDAGVVEVERVIDGKRQQSQYEVDFIVNTGSEQVYIQSALNVDTKDKMEQETFSLRNIRDSFRKIVILDGNTHPWMNDEGVTFMGVIPFLLGTDKALI